MKHWYAVQENESDELDNGSYDLKEAREIAHEIAEENGIAYIAYIDEENNFCDGEEIITYEDGEFDSRFEN